MLVLELWCNKRSAYIDTSFVEEEAPFRNTRLEENKLEETKARNDCAGEGQQKCNQPTERGVSQSVEESELVRELLRFSRCQLLL
jgi:hypothetical protein